MFQKQWVYLQLIISAMAVLVSTSVFSAGSIGGGAIKVVSIMDKASLQKIYADPFVVSDKDEDLDVWPLYKQEVTGLNLVGYIYESINFSTIPGFMGIPYNLLVVIDTQGTFVDVRVLYHREPMFVGGVGEGPMQAFVEQYPGLSLMQNIKFSAKQGQKTNNDSHNIYLDGISGATASIRVLNQTLLSSALKVARAKLGFGTAKDPDLIAKIDQSVFETWDWDGLLKAGLIHKVVLKNKDVEALFAGSTAQRRDPIALKSPDESLIELYVTDLAIPTVGKNLLTPESWQFLVDGLKQGDHAFLVASTGRYSFKAEDFMRGNIADRLVLRQEGLPIELRDIDLQERLDLLRPDYKIKFADGLQQPEWMVFQVIGTSGIDISLPLDFELAIVRGMDEVYFQPLTKGAHFSYHVPDDYYFEPDSADKTWVSIWRDKVWDLAILSAAVLLLFAVLAKPQWLTVHARYFSWFRLGFLCFTLFFIGWYGQAQLSIVNVTGALQSLMSGGNLNFFLYDPMSLVLWGFVLITIVVWGRGTFCGWLCPFGALQELTSRVFGVFKLKQYRPTVSWDARLKKLKYWILFAIIAMAMVSPTWTDRLVEIEPFKTSITFYFVRAWPFVVWALAAVFLSVFVYKGYCRYLCPLGAVMSILGRFRVFNWLKRRKECGSPCQLCKHACQYQSILPKGQVDYAECFQCLDCVVIHDNDTMCAISIVEVRNKAKQEAAKKESVEIMIPARSL